MNCQTAQERLLEKFESALTANERQELELHLSGCTHCAQFNRRQNALDLQLRQTITAPLLGPGFRAAVLERIRGEPKLWPEWLPDVAHLIGSAMAITLCVILLPFPAVTVLGVGTTLAITTYSLQALIVSSWEELESGFTGSKL